MPRFSVQKSRTAAGPAAARVPKPRWLKVPAAGGPRYEAIRRRLEGLGLHTVCQEAQCPNMGECWGGGTATIMLMGGTCTRGCRFCAVETGRPAPLDPREPESAARAVAAMGVDYIVITSVNRDDLPDGGAFHFARTVTTLRGLAPQVMIEVLVPDFQGRLASVDALIEAGPEVIAHNVETVPRLSRTVRDARASFEQSLGVLAHVKAAGRGRGPGGVDILAKTSIMLGLGEGEAEVQESLERLRAVGTDVVTFGQYLRPSPKHHEVVEYVEPAVFDAWADRARAMGFLYVASGPLVRSSYRAGEYYLHAHLAQARRERGVAS
ncbi:MAG: lipoyl synthase [Deltaproteobacteria bacterium]|nr:lipoyl synthase [Deltaproteobacteria bacterium]